METFTDIAAISEPEMRQLLPLLGCSLHSLMLHQTGLELRGEHHVLSPSFSVQDGSGRFVVVENEWRETPGGWHYGRLSIGCADHPPGTEQARGGLLAHNVLRMKPFQSTPPVKQIDIFERALQSQGQSSSIYGGEHVRYDAAIVFRREDNSVFRLSPEDGPLGRVEFCQMWRDIYDISAHLKRRVMITERGIDLNPPPA